MLKLNASYSKKVPADTEYSSQSFHASVEVELPDGLTQDQLNAKIHETFDLVRASVEAELNENFAQPQPALLPQENAANAPQMNPPAQPDRLAVFSKPFLLLCYPTAISTALPQNATPYLRMDDKFRLFRMAS